MIGEISLVIPVRDEENSLGDLSEAIQSQSRAPDEIVLVDGGSTDRTPEIARGFADADPRFRLVMAGPATPGRGRNVGIRAARNDWIALTDAGIVLDPDWLDVLTRQAEQSRCDVVYGNYKPVRDTFFTACAALAYVPGEEGRPGGGRSRGPSIASCLLRRSVWEAVGGFPDLRAGEDLIFMEKVQKSGARIAWAPAAVVYWQLRPDLLSTFRKFCLYSKHNVWAGRMNDWHFGIARTYLLAMPFIGLAAFNDPAWLLLPVFGAFARVTWSIRRRADPPRWRSLINPAVIAMVLVIRTAIDLATFVGWIQASRETPPQSSPCKVTE